MAEAGLSMYVFMFMQEFQVAWLAGDTAGQLAALQRINTLPDCSAAALLEMHTMCTDIFRSGET